MTTLADGTALAPTPVVGSGVRSTVAAYVALTKPRIIELLLVTTVPTMVLAQGGMPSLGLVLATLVGGTLAAGSANALNCYYDRDIDQVMHRTARRPLARRTVPPRNALVFGLVLGVLATALLAATTNLLAAALGVSPYTVQDHIRHACDKLGVDSRRQLGALLLGRITPPAPTIHAS